MQSCGTRLLTEVTLPLQTFPFDSIQVLSSPEAIVAFMNSALEDGSGSEITQAFRTAFIAAGCTVPDAEKMSVVARDFAGQLTVLGFRVRIEQR